MQTVAIDPQPMWLMTSVLDRELAGPDGPLVTDAKRLATAKVSTVPYALRAVDGLP